MFAEAISSLWGGSVLGGFRNASLENPRYSLNDPQLYDVLASGGKAASGVTVTHERALDLAAVWQALSLISGDIAKLSLYPFARLKDDEREVFTKHPGFYPCAIMANPWKSAFLHRRDRAVHLLLWNNSYSYKARGAGGRIELYNLLPDRTAPEWVTLEDGRTVLVYVTEVGGKLETLSPSQVLHLRGISIDGMAGCDLVKHARDAWGLALGAQGFQSKFFKNGARMGGTLELPATLQKGAMDKVEEGFRQTYEGGDNPFKTIVAREGVKFHAGQFSPEQALVTDVTEQGKRDVASYYNLPPSKLGIRDSMSYNSFEQDNLSYLHGCLHHWLETEADECNTKLLSEKERDNDTVYFAHNVSKFVQADWKTLNEGLEIMRRNEIISADEWRRKIDMNKRPDGKGGEYINPNTRSAASQGETKPPPAKEKAKNDHRGWLTDTLNRMARRLGTDARREAKNTAKFEAWLGNGYQQHYQAFDEAVQPVSRAIDSENFARDVRANFFNAMNRCLSPLLEPPYTAADLAANVDREMTKFEYTAGEKIASLLLENRDE